MRTPASARPLAQSTGAGRRSGDKTFFARTFQSRWKDPGGKVRDTFCPPRDYLPTLLLSSLGLGALCSFPAPTYAERLSFILWMEKDHEAGRLTSANESALGLIPGVREWQRPAVLMARFSYRPPTDTSTKQVGIPVSLCSALLGPAIPPHHLITVGHLVQPGPVPAKPTLPLVWPPPIASSGPFSLPCQAEYPVVDRSGRVPKTIFVLAFLTSHYRWGHERAAQKPHRSF